MAGLLIFVNNLISILKKSRYACLGLMIVFCLVFQFAAYLPIFQTHMVAMSYYSQQQLQQQQTKKHSSPHSSLLHDDLHLFVSAFPDGFEELQTTLIRTLEFFWPYNTDHNIHDDGSTGVDFNMVVVLDDTTVMKKKTTNVTRTDPTGEMTDDEEQEREARKNMTQTVQSLFTGRRNNNVMVQYNPRSNQSIYGKGWVIQQLIMFWADNFTDSKYIGFLDDDALFTKGIQIEDLFDICNGTDGQYIIKPRVILYYQTETELQIGFVKRWHHQSFLAYKEPSYTNAMSYFPVVIHRRHLLEIRQAMLDAHYPKYNYFDELSIDIISKQTFSQFLIMFDHLWRYRRDDYTWHFEALYNQTDGTDRPSNSTNVYPNIKAGTPAENGITPKMLQPFPRCVMHANYQREWKANIEKKTSKYNNTRVAYINEILRRGYCFSQPRNSFSNSIGYTPNNVPRSPTLYSATAAGHDDGEAEQEDEEQTLLIGQWCNKSYNVYEDINADSEWDFSDGPWGENWSKFKKEEAKRAHLDRLLKNQVRHWDPNELKTIFNEII